MVFLSPDILYLRRLWLFFRALRERQSARINLLFLHTTHCRHCLHGVAAAHIGQRITQHGVQRRIRERRFLGRFNQNHQFAFRG